MADFEFKWLHLSDLHAGMTDQGWLWPTLKHSLFEDLTKIHPLMGDWHAVIFTGDLTYRGARDEFDRLDQILGELWVHFKRLGFQPTLIVTPGNHDIARPSPKEPKENGGMTPREVRSVGSIAGWGNADAMGVAVNCDRRCLARRTTGCRRSPARPGTRFFASTARCSRSSTRPGGPGEIELQP